MVTLTVKEKRLFNILEPEDGTWSGEVVAFCPQCKALQTLFINDNKLLPTRKFFQEGNLIYHDCGSNRPCHIYDSW